MERRIYADNAATTRVTEPVLQAMLPYFTEQYGNPSSIYKLGRDAHSTIKDARQRIAKCLGAEENEIYFTETEQYHESSAKSTAPSSADVPDDQRNK